MSPSSELWPPAIAERANLVRDLETLTPEQWLHPSLCQGWNVEQVVAHLTAAGSLGRGRWLRSMLGARFRPDIHNARQVQAHRGRTPTETLERFRAVITSTTAPSGHTPAYVGEVFVHAQDIRFPLGLPSTSDVPALTPVAHFFARRDFTVSGRTRTRGLALRADDGPFTAGAGDLVTGTTLALVMAMAGRAAYAEQLRGPGAAVLLARVGTGAEPRGDPPREPGRTARESGGVPQPPTPPR